MRVHRLRDYNCVASDFDHWAADCARQLNGTITAAVRAIASRCASSRPVGRLSSALHQMSSLANVVGCVGSALVVEGTPAVVAAVGSERDQATSLDVRGDAGRGPRTSCTGPKHKITTISIRRPLLTPDRERLPCTRCVVGTSQGESVVVTNVNNESPVASIGAEESWSGDRTACRRDDNCVRSDGRDGCDSA